MRRGGRLGCLGLAALVVAAASACVPETPPASSTSTVTVGGHSATVSVPSTDTVTATHADPSSIPALPIGLVYPYGALNIRVGGLAVGGSVVATVALDGPATTVRKLIGDAWDPFAFDGTTGAELSADGRTITLHLTDGGRGDRDGVANGTIVDPLAPGVTAGSYVGTTSTKVNLPLQGGESHLVESMNAPAGTWMVTATASVENFGLNDYVRCSVSANGTALDTSTTVVGDQPPGPSGEQGPLAATVAMQALITTSATERFSLECRHDTSGAVLFLNPGASLAVVRANGSVGTTTSAQTSLVSAPSTDTSVATVNLPAGSWVVSGKATAVNFGTNDYVRCGLSSGGTQLDSSTTLVGNGAAGPSGEHGPSAAAAVTQATVTLPSSASVTLSCRHDGANAGIYLDPGSSLIATHPVGPSSTTSSPTPLAGTDTTVTTVAPSAGTWTVHAKATPVAFGTPDDVTCTLTSSVATPATLATSTTEVGRTPGSDGQRAPTAATLEVQTVTTTGAGDVIGLHCTHTQAANPVILDPGASITLVATIGPVDDETDPTGLQPVRPYKPLQGAPYTQWLVLKCAFSDVPDARPLPAGVPSAITSLDDMVDDFLSSDNSTGNVVDYLRDVTYGRIHLKTDVYGWITAPYPTTTGLYRTDRVQACANAAPASYHIDFNRYAGVLMVENQSHDGGACGIGPLAMTIQGVPRQFGCLQLDPAGMYTAYAAHEFLHALGLIHSYNSAGVEYGDPTDIMSALNTDQTASPNYPASGGDTGLPGGGPGASLPNLLKLNAIPAARLASWSGTTDGTDPNGKTYVLDPLSEPGATNPLGVVISNLPSGGGVSADQFTIEYREQSGWDGGLHRAGVVIHQYAPAGAPWSILEYGRGDWILGEGDSYRDTSGRFVLQVTSVDSTTRTATVRVLPPPGPFAASQITAGGSHSCAIVAGGHVSCWGGNNVGQLGNGSPYNSVIPVPVAGLAGVTQVDAGDSDTCALLGDGTVKCWGDGIFGELGNGTTSPGTTPAAVTGLSGVTKVAAGGGHACAIVAGGAVKCWGHNQDGQLGDGTEVDSSVPVPVTGIIGATDISIGVWHSCALVGGGAVKCWGGNEVGQLGTGSTDAHSDAPVTVALTAGAMSIGSGGYHACAVLAGGSVQCWGYNASGALGDGTTFSRFTPVAVVGLTGVTQVQGGSGHTCALLSGGAAACWGGNTYGAVGNPASLQNQLVPIAVVGVTGATSLTTGGFHSCAIVSGLAKCWGLNVSGQLGDGLTGNATTPADVVSY